jgi:hypothetical protein
MSVDTAAAVVGVGLPSPGAGATAAATLPHTEGKAHPLKKMLRPRSCTLAQRACSLPHSADLDQRCVASYKATRETTKHRPRTYSRHTAHTLPLAPCTAASDAGTRHSPPLLSLLSLLLLLLLLSPSLGRASPNPCGAQSCPACPVLHTAHTNGGWRHAQRGGTTPVAPCSRCRTLACALRLPASVATARPSAGQLAASSCLAAAGGGRRRPRADPAPASQRVRRTQLEKSEVKSSWSHACLLMSEVNIRFVPRSHRLRRIQKISAAGRG